MHEPSQLAYDSIKYPHETHDWFLESAQNSSVFVNEISFAVQDFLKEDTELTVDPCVQFAFLLRNPHHATVSFYKKCEGMFVEDEQNFSDLIGYKAAYELYNALSTRAIHKPIIILSENLYTHPEETIKLFCKQASLAYKPEALVWPGLDNSFDGQEWHEIKHEQLMHHWHGDAIKSRGFAKPAHYDLDDKNYPTFIEVSDERYREVCRKAYDANKYYYDLLLESVGP